MVDCLEVSKRSESKSGEIIGEVGREWPAILQGRSGEAYPHPERNRQLPLQADKKDGRRGREKEKTHVQDPMLLEIHALHRLDVDRVLPVDPEMLVPTPKNPTQSKVRTLSEEEGK